YGKRSKHFITALASLQEELGRAKRRISARNYYKHTQEICCTSFALGGIHGALESEAVQHATSSTTGG
ncbi:MAG: inorganic triphosphatase, partial [Nitrosomonas sp.]|nr:inorganic triphosphatase [Nitrosomonas sp.]